MIGRCSLVFGAGLLLLDCGSSTDGSSGASAGSTSPGGSGGAPSSTSGSAGTPGGTAAQAAGTAATGAAGAPEATAGAAGQSGGSHNLDDPVPCAELASFITAYKAAHSGNGGKDWDVNAKTPAELSADPDARRLMALCGEDQRPVIPLLAWEYGGADHAWINPEQSALVYCVYTPVASPTEHWAYDAGQNQVTADVYVACPEQNPCSAKAGAEQVAACIGDATNFEILVDTASYDDGADAGLMLSSASTELTLILADQTKVHLHSD